MNQDLFISSDVHQRCPLRIQLPNVIATNLCHPHVHNYNAAYVATYKQYVLAIVPYPALAS